MSAPRYPLHARVTELEAMFSVLDGKLDCVQVAIAAMVEARWGRDRPPPLELSAHASGMLAEARRRADENAELDRRRAGPRHGMRVLPGDGEDTGAERAGLRLVKGGAR